MKIKSVEQQISELVDGELDAKELEGVLLALRKDAKLAGQWERSFMMREALRQGLAARVDTGFASRVRKAVETEPAYLLPSAQRSTPVSSPSNASPDTRFIPRSRKAVAGLAVAASVFMVVGTAVVKMNTAQWIEAPLNQGLVAQQRPGAVTAQPTVQVAATRPVVAAQVAAKQSPGTVTAQNAQQVWEHLHPPQRGLTLEEYLVDHSAFSEHNTVRGFVPYARVVGYPAQSP